MLLNYYTLKTVNTILRIVYQNFFKEGGKDIFRQNKRYIFHGKKLHERIMQNKMLFTLPEEGIM